MACSGKLIIITSDVHRAITVSGNLLGTLGTGCSLKLCKKGTNHRTSILQNRKIKLRDK